MVTFLAEYGLFVAKALTVVFAALVVFGTIFASSARGRKEPGGQIKVRQLNEQLEEVERTIKEAVLPKEQIKEAQKAEKKHKKQQHKADKKALKKSAKKDKPSEQSKKRVYVLDFDGDVKASAVESLRKEITAVLSMARQVDEVVLRLESPGGMVHSYGLASSQLERIKNKGIPLTICVDKVAASGGYMMACIADQIVAAPFAILGSIGVIAQLPNFHRLLKKNDIDFELFTAGEYKRTVTTMGENTDKGREKFKEELEDTHVLFKEFVGTQRSKVDIDKVATGEHWYGTRAKELDLVDELKTSDEYLVDACDDADVYEVEYKQKRSMADRFGLGIEDISERLMFKAYRLFEGKFF